mmetsp:Transcript_5697/g.17510  ORF Transcript_5697/g.17510 Transcript_5697/m.17510 type:complete len:276 (+) Transcript_5697:515-1342(+)
MRASGTRASARAMASSCTRMGGATRAPSRPAKSTGKAPSSTQTGASTAVNTWRTSARAPAPLGTPTAGRTREAGGTGTKRGAASLLTLMGAYYTESGSQTGKCGRACSLRPTNCPRGKCWTVASRGGAFHLRTRCSSPRSSDWPSVVNRAKLRPWWSKWREACAFDVSEARRIIGAPPQHGARPHSSCACLLAWYVSTAHLDHMRKRYIFTRIQLYDNVVFLRRTCALTQLVLPQGICRLFRLACTKVISSHLISVAPQRLHFRGMAGTDENGSR